MPSTRSTGKEREAHYKALQTEKANLFGGRVRIPVCKGCYERHVRCPGPEVDNNGNYDYSKRCLRCIDSGNPECDFESKMSALPRRSLAVMTEKELSTVMRTNKEMGKMHPREASMCNIRRRRVNVEHFRHLSSNITTSNHNQSDSGTCGSQPPTQSITTQSITTSPITTSPITTPRFTTQPSRLILPDGRLAEYATQPSRVMLHDGRVIEYTIVPLEHDDNIAREQVHEATANEIALAIQEQEDRRMQLHFLPPQMYLDPSVYEGVPADQL